MSQLVDACDVKREIRTGKEVEDILLELCTIVGKYIAMKHLRSMLMEMLNAAAVLILTSEHTKSDNDLTQLVITMITSLYYERHQSENDNEGLYLYPIVYLESMISTHSLITDSALRLSRLCRVNEEPLEALYHCLNAKRLFTSMDDHNAYEKEKKRIRCKALALIKSSIKQYGCDERSSQESKDNKALEHRPISFQIKKTGWFVFGLACFSFGLGSGLLIGSVRSKKLV